ncbi:MAG: ATP-binding protein [Candidatus Gracilibacteria bacterium]|nr:ATP-binding protein [Candidatus Gracilibacteria bacterium]
MKNLSITLNQDYKSFDAGFRQEFEGDLIIISGVNGSGKSQLLNIIKNEDSHNGVSSIKANIILDGNILQIGNILYRSIRENINIPNLTQATPQNIINYKNIVSGHYIKTRLNLRDQSLKNFQQSSKLARKYLIDKYGDIKFDSGRLTREEIDEAIPNTFIWKTDDIFTNFIGDIFFNYASRKLELKAKKSDEGILSSEINFDYEIGIAPWVEFNELFGKVGFEYRFKTNYKISNSQINEQPKLYGIKKDGSIDEDQSRDLNDLSDGEKAIISFVFGSLSGIKKEDIKILLLDEFDATLNPSLIKMFFQILDTYFIKKGIQVIIVTHSPATISLTPNYAIFYEVFKKNASERIEKVQKHNYIELEIVNREFYEKISNQEDRISELKAENKKLEDVKEKIQNLELENKPLIITEGKTDWKHLKAALKKFNPNYSNLDINFLEYDEDIKMGDNELLNMCQQYSKTPHSEKIIFIFDRDNKNIINKVEKEGKPKNWGNNIYSFAIPKPNFRTFDNVCIEHYYNDSDLILEDDNGRRLFLGTEFLQNGNSKNGRYQTIKKDKCTKDTIIDEKVYHYDDYKTENSIALTKNNFAENILNEVNGFEKIALDNFKIILSIIEDIVKV